MRVWMKRASYVAALVCAVVTVAAPAASAATPQEFSALVADILDEPYQPNYVPAGTDTAFPGTVPNTFPVQDYTSGSVPGNPDHPGWPPWFQLIEPHYSLDGAPLISRLAIHKDANDVPLSRPGVVVVHGFNTRAKESVVRWAAMLYANGYHVLAADQRDFNAEFMHAPDPEPWGWPKWLQTFGWKESEDVLAAGQFLKSQPGVTSVGVVGFSLGGQDTVLGAARDPFGQVFSAALNFSGPADQNAQIYSTAAPPGCQPPDCTYPTTDGLIVLVVPPYNRAPNTGKYDDPCEVLVDAAARYQTTPQSILLAERAYRAQTQLSVPLLNFYSQDDSLVQPFHATMMRGYEQGNPLRGTFLIQRGEHAYFFDRWWQQRAILLYFKALLPGASTAAEITTNPTVNQTPGGAALSTQLVDLGSPTPADADALQKPLICPGTPTAVVVRSFTAARAGSRIAVRWRTGNEARTVGFHIYRSQRTGRIRVNRTLIAAQGAPAGAAYTFRHRLPPDARSPRYWLEEVRVDGTRASRGPVPAH